VGFTSNDPFQRRPEPTRLRNQQPFLAQMLLPVAQLDAILASNYLALVFKGLQLLQDQGKQTEAA